MNIEPRGNGSPAWVLVLVPLAAWAVIDVLRVVQGHQTRSAVAETVLRRALSLDATAERVVR